MVATDRVRWTVDDLALLPSEKTRYEVIAGDLYMTHAPHWNHQNTCSNISAELRAWSLASGFGKVTEGVGVIFSEEDAVIPDVVWLSNDRFDELIDESGHLTGAPDLAVEVLSAGTDNEKRAPQSGSLRDRQVKLKLYSIQGVQEYWIADWRQKKIEVYRRENAILRLKETLFVQDTIASPLLPDFNCAVERFFL
ncbi:MAG: Uma2 family endonuclease [Limnothrix sp.]